MVSNNRRDSRRSSGRLKDPEAMDDVDEEEPTPSEEDTESTPKFQVKQRVYAQDAQSSLWYDAVIRRSLYGVHYNKQVQIGLITSESEIEEILAQPEAPSWHYFVHYNGWKTNYDRWVSEESIMEQNEESRRIVDRYTSEHTILQKEMKMKRGKGKGDGTAFLNAWSKRMVEVAENLKREAEGKGSKKHGKDSRKNQGRSKALGKDKPKPKKRSAADQWNKAAIEREYKLRLRGLEGKRTAQDQNKLTLPFSLKKVMVEAWEIITQCQMVPNLPAKVSVRQGLDKYLQYKLELIVPQIAANSADDKQQKASPTKIKMGEENMSEEEKLQKKRQEWIDMVEGITMFFDEALPFRLLYSQELAQYKIVESTFVTEDETAKSDDSAGDKWIEVETAPIPRDEEKAVGSPTAGGIKMGSPTAGGIKMEVEGSPTAGGIKMEVEAEATSSPSTEKADTSKPTANEKSDKLEKPSTRKMEPSEVYGCEHLLRLCLKVPELLSEKMPTPKSDDESGMDALAAYEHESKQILAKISDLIRFLHKHQSTMFADSFRKLNEAEIREEQKFVKSMERKRKRAAEDKVEASVATATVPGGAVDAESTEREAQAPSNKAQKVS